jgi:hypothetical protein
MTAIDPIEPDTTAARSPRGGTIPFLRCEGCGSEWRDTPSTDAGTAQERRGERLDREITVVVPALRTPSFSRCHAQRCRVENDRSAVVGRVAHGALWPVSRSTGPGRNNLQSSCSDAERVRGWKSSMPIRGCRQKPSTS